MISNLVLCVLVKIQTMLPRISKIKYFFHKYSNFKNSRMYCKVLSAISDFEVELNINIILKVFILSLILMASIKLDLFFIRLFTSFHLSTCYNFLFSNCAKPFELSMGVHWKVLSHVRFWNINKRNLRILSGITVIETILLLAIYFPSV